MATSCPQILFIPQVTFGDTFPANCHVFTLDTEFSRRERGVWRDYPSALGGVTQPYFSWVFIRDLYDACAALSENFRPSLAILAFPLMRAEPTCVTIASIV